MTIARNGYVELRRKGFMRHAQISLIAIAFGLVSFLCANGLVRGDTITLTPSADTTLFEDFPNYNLGAAATMIVGRTANTYTNRALIKFDIAGSIPSNAVIASARLTLSVTRAHPFFAANSTFALHRTLRDWGEGTKSALNPTGEPATDGEATWHARFYPDVLWDMPGAAAGIDYSETVSASQFISAPAVYTLGPTDGLAADVQLWLTNSAANFGWILISESEDVLYTSRRIGSREDPANAPVLTVEFTAPPPAPRIDFVEVVGDQFQLHFVARSGHSYVVESRESLNEADGWIGFTNVPPPDVTGPVTVSVPLSGAQKFFRIGEQ